MKRDIRRRDLARQARLSNDDREQRAIDALQVRDQCRLDAVAREPDRASLQQRFGRDAHYRLKEIDGGVAPERAVETLAESDPRRRGVVNRGRDEFAAAKLEESPVADAVQRRPVTECGQRRFWKPTL